VGRFELRRQLGKGGCGIVFLAYDPKLEREVALKIPRPEMLLSQDARRRLIREALAAAEFDHPNLVPVYESGEIGPVCYIATAFCPGQTLGDWLEKQAYPVPVRQAARLVATIAEAVQHAHDRGVLHRDLKPANVILQATKDDPNEQEPPPGSCQLRGEQFIPRVVDFGLAKLFERGGPSETGTRQVLGTPKYMSPEQAQARHQDVGPAADVYALGVILYEMLTGRAPYEAASDVEVLRLAIEGHLTLPRHLRRDIPRDLEAICLKAMHRSPSQRYRTAIDLADDLRRFLDGKPTLARPLNWLGRSGRWLRRNDQAVALGTVTFIALFFFSVWAWNRYESQRLNTDRDAAARQDEEARALATQQREYARSLREAFLAWQAGDTKAAAAALEAATQWAQLAGDAPDFTQGYLTRLIAARRLHIVCPAGPVTALAVSADGTRLASGHADGTLAVWNRSTGEQLGSHKAHATSITQVAFALGDSRLLTVGELQSGVANARHWMLDAAGQITPLAEPLHTLGKDITSLGVSPDGTTVFAGTHSGELRTIHLADAATRSRQVTQADPIQVITVLASGTGVLIGTSSGKVLRVDANLQQAAAEDAYGGPITGLLESGGRQAVVALTSNVAVLTGSDWVYRPTRGRVNWVVPLDAGFATSDAPGRVLLRSPHWGELPTGDRDEVRAGAVTRDGKTLFTAGDDGIIRSWEVGTDLRLQGSVAASGVVQHVAIHPDGQTVCVVTPRSVTMGFGTPAEQPGPSGRTFATVCQLRTGKAVGPLLGVEFHKDAVVVTELTGRPDTPEKLRFTLPDGAVGRSAAISAESQRLAVGDDRGRILIWSLLDGRNLAVIDSGQRTAINRVAISDSGMYVAAPIGGTTVVAWLVTDSKPRLSIPSDDQAVCRFVANSDRLVTSGRSGVIRVWNLGTGQSELTLRGHVGRVCGLAVTTDMRTLASGSATGEVKLWDLRSGQEVLSLRRHSSPVTVVEFAANGKLLVTGSTHIALWETPE
jgi:serine/threonine protein kinase/WD40 repeat protein